MISTIFPALEGKTDTKNTTSDSDERDHEILKLLEQLNSARERVPTDDGTVTRYSCVTIMRIGLFFAHYQLAFAQWNHASTTA